MRIKNITDGGDCNPSLYFLFLLTNIYLGDNIFVHRRCGKMVSCFIYTLVLALK